MTDSVDVKVNLEEIIEVGEEPYFTGVDKEGAIICTDAGALWRLDSADLESKKIAGGGTQELTLEGEKTSLEEAYLEGHFCEIENGVYWGIAVQSERVLIKVDTSKDEVECILTSTGEEEPGEGGLYGEGVPYDQKAKLCEPRGPLVLLPGPNGPHIFFYDWRELRVVDLATKTIRTLPFHFNGFIHHPKSIWTSNDAINHHLPTDSVDKCRPVANRMMTWVTDTETQVTHLVDLSTGENAILFNTMLHPLCPISSSLVLSIEVTENGEAWIVLVDWTLPSELESSPVILEDQKSCYSLPYDRITHITQLPGEFNGPTCQFLFDPSSNTLYESSELIKRFSNIFEITSKTSSGHTVTLYPSSLGEFVPELSKLVISECPLPSDIELHHAASNTTWKVHRDILCHHECLKTSKGVDRMIGVIKHSTLPLESISAFINFIYFSSPIDQTRPIESFMSICHCIQLCNQIEMGERSIKYLLWLLEEIIVPELSNETLLSNILTLWFIEQDSSPESATTYSESSLLMNLLASRCRIYMTDSEIRKALNEFDLPKTPLSMSQGILLGASLVFFLSPNSETELLEQILSPSPPGMDPQPLEWDENLSSSSPAPPNSPYSFIFTIEGLETGGVVCNALLLYAQWKWFERLIKIGGVEVQTRHVAMPSELTPSALIAMLSVPHGTYQEHHTIPSLSTIDLANVYRFSEQFELPDSPSFANFVRECKEILFSAVNEQNCIDKLRTFWEAGIEFNSELFVDTLEVVVQISEHNPIADILKLPFQVMAAIHAYNADPEQFKSGQFFPQHHARLLSSK